MSETNLLHHFNFILKFWEDILNYVEWHEGQVIPIPKSGDLSDPNKWIGVNLMDIGAKVFSSMMCKRLFKIINLHGVKYQFGYSPGVGYQDCLFTLKNALHARHNHNLPTFFAFVDLVKAFGTVDHGIMIVTLKIYGAPPKLISSIARMYADLKIVLKIGKLKDEMKKTVGARQGECMVPVLFLFTVMSFLETLEKEWKNHFIKKCLNVDCFSR